jgi:hypothetical protein
MAVGRLLEANVPGLTHNPPSFSHARYLLGTRSGIFFRVNGKLYGASQRFDEAAPDFRELHPGDFRGTIDKIIPYSDEAWSTVVRVEQALCDAATMLHGLIKSEHTEALLKGGMTGLMLGAPPANLEEK